MVSKPVWKYLREGPPALPGGSQSVVPYLIAAATRAPSGDNCQPWRFTASDDRIELYLNPGADTSFFNVRQLASMIACGFAIENMVIAASALGRRALVTLLPEGPDALCMAHVRLGKSAAPPDELHDALWVRKTNRKRYARAPVSSQLLQSLRDAAALGGSGDTSLHLVAGAQELREAASLVFAADRIRTERQDLHEHFMRMVRFSQQDAIASRDGLPLPNLEAGIAGSSFLRVTKAWSVMRALGWLGLGSAVAHVSYQGILSSAGVGLLVAGPRGAESALRGGRALARTWLTATRLGLLVQPMTAITLFWERCERGCISDFSPRHQAMLQALWPRYRALFPLCTEGDRTHVMLFRFGTGADIEYGTYRKPLDQLM